MPRTAVVVRDAVAGDTDALLHIWSDFTSGGQEQDRGMSSAEQVERSLIRLQTEPCERLVVAVVDDAPVGVAHFRRAPISPLHDEDAVHVGYLHVLSGFRRRGVGKSLLHAAAEWAEAKDSKHVVASVAANAREANRFLARLGLGQVAVVRATTVAGLRCKLAVDGDPRNIDPKLVAKNVVATRRLRRRTRLI